MKKNFSSARSRSASALCAGLACAFVAANFALADEDTNTASAVSNNLSALTVTAKMSSEPANALGLPKEALDRLSPEQIMKLMQERQVTFGTERVPEMIATVLIPLGMFSMIIACVAIGVTARLKRNRMLHETVRMMIEKGQPIPPELLQPQETARRPRSDLRTGLVLVAIGIGLCGLGLSIGSDKAKISGLGLIPILMGVAFLIAWKIEAKRSGPSK